MHKYATSLVLPIFKKDFLLNIVEDSDTPWKFEKQSNKRFNFNNHKFLFIKGNNLNFRVANLIVRGEALRTSINRIPLKQRLKYIRNSKKKKKSLLKEFRYHFKKLFSDLFVRYLPYI